MVGRGGIGEFGVEAGGGWGYFSRAGGEYTGGPNDRLRTYICNMFEHCQVTSALRK